jgi:hypothetical protein
MDVILLILLSFNVLEFCIFGFIILQDCMALLAYEEPETSPMFSLLSMDHRQSVADALNCAILAHANLPSYTSMERLLQHTTVVRQYLNQELGKV